MNNMIQQFKTRLLSPKNLLTAEAAGTSVSICFIAMRAGVGAPRWRWIAGYKQKTFINSRGSLPNF